MKPTRNQIIIAVPLALAMFGFIALYSQGLATNCQNPISYYLYCNTIPSYEMQAMAWINQTMGSTQLPYTYNATTVTTTTTNITFNYYALSIALIAGVVFSYALIKYVKLNKG